MISADQNRFAAAPPVYFSVKVREDLTEFLLGKGPREDAARMGFAHYTYKIVARRFVGLLNQHGIAAKELDYPEMYDVSTLPDRGSSTQKPLHLIFKPAEEIRILRGAYNIGLVAWEFDKITTSSVTGNPSSNQLRMLSLLDEMWVASRHFKKILEDNGLRNVRYIPCPVDTAEPVSNLPRLRDWLGDVDSIPVQFDGWPTTSEPLRDTIPADAGSHASPIILSIFNPNDARKDFQTLLRGFFSAEPMPGHEPTLLIKLIIDNVETSLDEVLRSFRNQQPVAATKSIKAVCFSKFLSDDEMAWLYRSCQFYLSASRGEGQNLPLIEAMGHGCLPISPSHTSMADYINSDTAIVIPSERKRADPLSNAFKSSEFFWHQSDPKGVGRCIETALRLPANDRERILKNARMKAAELYSPAAVWSAIASRIEALR